MEPTPCEAVQGALAGQATIAPELSAHVAGCPRCRGALAAILAEQYAVPPPADQAGCNSMDDLPAYLDLEQSDGAAAAARYPHVWWHLWVCPTCAEEARLTRALLAAEASGELGPVPALAAPAPAPAEPWPILELARSFLHQLFGPQLALGTAWGDDDPAFLIAEESRGIYHVALYARPGAAELWALRLVVSPPIKAVAVLRFGRRAFRAPFDASGAATVAAVPAAFLTGAQGPPLRVTIERPGS